MEVKEISLITPEMEAGNWSIDWLVGDKSSVEAGDPIAVVERKGQRLLAFSPVTGLIDIIIKSPLVVDTVAIVIAKVLSKHVEFKKDDAIMDDAQKVYMEKMDTLIKGAVKKDFDSVKRDLKKIKNDVSSLKTDFSSVKSDMAAIKAHLGIK